MDSRLPDSATMSTTPAVAARGRCPPHERQPRPCLLTVPSGWERPIRGSATCSVMDGKGIARLMATAGSRWRLPDRDAGALLDFQRDHGIRQTGDIDPPTRGSLPRRGREVDRLDTSRPGARRRSTRRSSRRLAIPITRPPPRPAGGTRAGGHQRGAQAPCFGYAHRPALGRAAFRDEAGCHTFAAIGTSPEMLAMLERGNRLLAAAQEDSEARSRSRRSPMRRYA